MQLCINKYMYNYLRNVGKDNGKAYYKKDTAAGHFQGNGHKALGISQHVSTPVKRHSSF